MIGQWLTILGLQAAGAPIMLQWGGEAWDVKHTEADSARSTHDEHPAEWRTLGYIYVYIYSKNIDLGLEIRKAMSV